MTEEDPSAVVVPGSPSHVSVLEGSKNYAVLAWTPSEKQGNEGLSYFVERVRPTFRTQTDALVNQTAMVIIWVEMYSVIPLPHILIFPLFGCWIVPAPCSFTKC